VLGGNEMKCTEIVNMEYLFENPVRVPDGTEHTRSVGYA
jgi:hypothetical protein